MNRPGEGVLSLSYSYDKNGNLTGRTDARGVGTTYIYDALNRLTSKTYTNGNGTPAVTYTYDNVPNAKGRLTQVANANSITNVTAYDPLGRVTGSNQVTGGQTYNFSYAYNLSGAMTSETYPSGRTIATSYDLANRPTSVVGNGTTSYVNIANSANFAPHGGILSITLGNGLVQTQQFNSLLQPTQIAAGSLLTLNLTFPSGANNGNLQSMSIARPSVSVSQTYGYDAVNRLSTATQTGTSSWTQSYNYDQFGNRWFGNAGPNTVTSEMTTTNWYNAASNRVNGWTYDAAGNVVGITTTAGGITSGPSCAPTFGAGTMMKISCYDAENRLTTMATAAAPNATTYAYDGSGHRIMKTIGSTTTVYVYDAQGNLTAEYGGSNSSSGTQYLTTDHLGSTRLVTDQSGSVAKTFDYLPFGEEIGGTSSTGPTQRFTGQERDTESGIDFFKARYASAPQGRFQSPDPAGMFVADPTNPQSWNLYAYVMNNPLKYIDPTGMDVICNDDPDNFACTDDPTPPPVDENPGASPSATNSPNLGSWDSGGAFSGGFTLYATGYGGASQQPFAFSTSVAGASTNGGGRSSARGTQESKLRCTNRVANGFSIAGVIESAFDTEKHPYAAWTLDALAGNTFSGIGSIAEDFRTDPFKTYGDIIGGGLSQGLPGIGEALVKVGAPITLSKGLFGAATDIALASTPLGWGKFGFDALAYAGSALYCVTR